MRTGKKRWIAAAALVGVLLSTVTLTGCNKGADGKVSVVIGGWPSETDTNSATYAEYKRIMNEKYPDIEIIPDTTMDGNAKSYVTRASSGQLPNLYVVSYTEIPNIVRSNFAEPIAEYSKKYNYTQNINPLLLDKVTYNGEIYGIPSTAYASGLVCNRKMFEAAGLVNEDGTLQYPATYEELAETAKKIKDATGQAGFVFPSTNNQGGWIFTCVAWSYGVDFMEQDADGHWKSTFNTKECVDALSFIKDLKWKYGVLPDNAFIDVTEERKLFAADQAAMYIIHPQERMLTKTYGMDKDDICFARIPAGPKGRYSLMGGNVYMIAPGSTPAQIDAVFKFLEVCGHTPNVAENEDTSTWELTYQRDYNDGTPIAPETAFSLWIDGSRMALGKEIRRKYTNVPAENWSDYSSFTDVIVHEEEPECTQELYSILDSGIQEVLADRNADCAAIVARMANDFQVNHLDKLD